MRRVVALLAAVLLAGIALAACGGDGAEPGASDEATPATLVLDFQPNAVHSGIYLAAEDYDEASGVELRIREPSQTSDAPKLLEAGRAQFAVMDIHDLGLAAQEGFDVVGLMPIVSVPLASVLASPDIKRPKDLEGKTVGVTGLPSDDAVLESIVAGDGGDPSQVRRQNIGFDAVPALAAGKVDAATAFWNAEGVALRSQGTEINEFRVDDYGAPPYPELVLTTTRAELRDDPQLVHGVESAIASATSKVQADNVPAAIAPLLAANPSLDRDEQAAEWTGLSQTGAFSRVMDRKTLDAWANWDVEHGILSEPPDVGRLFPG